MNSQKDLLYQYFPTEFKVKEFVSTFDVTFWELNFQRESKPLYDLRMKKAKAIYDLECQDAFNLSDAENKKRLNRLKWLYDEFKAIHQILIFVEHLQNCYHANSFLMYHDFQKAVSNATPQYKALITELLNPQNDSAWT
jgi:hypothetical protein